MECVVREFSFRLWSSLYLCAVFVTRGCRQLYTLAWYMPALVDDGVVFAVAIEIRKNSSLAPCASTYLLHCLRRSITSMTLSEPYFIVDRA